MESMKDEQQTGFPGNPGSSPEGSQGTGSRDVRWDPTALNVDLETCERDDPCAYDHTCRIHKIKGWLSRGGAAAELYEALAKLVPAFERALIANIEDPEIRSAALDNHVLLKPARSALAKARGEA